MGDGSGTRKLIIEPKSKNCDQHTCCISILPTLIKIIIMNIIVMIIIHIIIIIIVIIIINILS